ncbi:MAG: hypothetical protein QOJ52_2248 [Acidimicrobiaceae bacterium]|nr:hypothetical protein [Acidimicrobiaceae bacterium]
MVHRQTWWKRSRQIQAFNSLSGMSGRGCLVRWYGLGGEGSFWAGEGGKESQLFGVARAVLGDLECHNVVPGPEPPELSLDSESSPTSWTKRGSSLSLPTDLRKPATSRTVSRSQSG